MTLNPKTEVVVQTAERLRALSSRAEELKLRLHSLEEKHKKEQAALKELEHQLEISSKSIEVMKRLVEVLSERGMRFLQDLLTFGLQTIFPDRQYSIRIDIKERGQAKTAEIKLLEGSEDDVRECNLANAVGGGIQTVVSLILRIYFIIATKSRRFLVLDEALSQLSEGYIEGLFAFLRQVQQELGFDILLITHDPRFLPYADRVYEMSQGGKIVKKQ